MKITNFLFVVILFSTQAMASFYVENDKIMTEVQTYKKGKKSIILIDMIHIAPQSFYRAVNQLISSYQSLKPIILEEGVRHCLKSGDTFFVPGDNANYDILNDLYIFQPLVSNEDTEIMLASAGFKKMICTTDASNKRPTQIDRFLGRFSSYGLLAGLGFMRSQGSVDLYPKNIFITTGDMASARFQYTASKTIASSIVECLLTISPSQGCKKFEAWAKTNMGKTLVDEFILERRNEVLLGLTFQSLGIENEFAVDYRFATNNTPAYDTAILPWGMEHMHKGLNQAIEKMGFVKTASSGIVFTSCGRLKKNEILKQIFDEDETVKAGCGL